MLACFLALSACTEPRYVPYPAADFYSFLLNGDPEGKAKNLALDTYVKNPSMTFVVKESGVPLPDVNVTQYYSVTGTPKEIAVLQALVTPVNATDDDQAPIYVVRWAKAPSNVQMSTFWVNIVVWIMFIGATLSAFLIWHCDDYGKDPLNSLLFVTDGSRIVNGE